MARWRLSVGSVWAILVGLCCLAPATWGQVNLSIHARPYRSGGLFTNPVLPEQGEKVTIGVQAEYQGNLTVNPEARLTLTDPNGKIVAQPELTLQRENGIAKGHWVWTAGPNGLYHLHVQLDPDHAIAESNERDNTADLVLPVIVKGRRLHFVWYGQAKEADIRWATCITSSPHKPAKIQQLAEHGIRPLDWEYGGMSWNYYDKKEAKTHPEKVLDKMYQVFLNKYRYDPAHSHGKGIDEMGGYPETFAAQRSAVAMKAMIQAKKENPKRFFAVWNGGGVTPQMAGLFRQGCDLLLLETYTWRAIPDDLSVDNIYQEIRDRIDPVVRTASLIVPAYGNSCYTLIGLGTPWMVDLGEQEQAVRYIRRICPEMRGLAFFEPSYEEVSAELQFPHWTKAQRDAHYRKVLAQADQLCFDYFVKPCLTFLPESLWLEPSRDGSCILTAALSNIGGLDAGAVTVEFWADGHEVGFQRLGRVPAGANRNQDRVLFKQRVVLGPGPHRLRAALVHWSDATVLDGSIDLSRDLP